MKLQRYDLAGDYGDDHVPMEHGNWCSSDDVRKLEQSHTELLEALKSIAEFWNRDQNEKAMIGACWHAVETAEAAIAKADDYCYNCSPILES